MDLPQKRTKSATVSPVAPQTLDQDKPCLMKSRVGICKLPLKVSSPSKQVVANPQSVVNGGSVTIHRPEYDADMIPVDEHNVWPVLEKVLAATQSMSMLLGSLKDDLQRSSALEARMNAGADTHSSDISFKRREAAVKLWRAFDAYLKSFVNIETYAQESSMAVKSGATPSSGKYS